MKTIKEFVRAWKMEMRDRVSKMDRPPVMSVFQIGHLEASERYVRNKKKDCDEVGIECHIFNIREDITQEEFDQLLELESRRCDGLMVQLPVPPQISVDRIKQVIKPEQDVDGFVQGSIFNPCTPGGIIKWLNSIDFKFDGANAVVIGRSDIVGKPMARMLLERNCTVSVCHSRTKAADLDRLCENADLIVCAVGRPEFIDADLYPNSLIVDVGINFVDGKMVGDVKGKKDRLPPVTPVPGGVGLLTRAQLLENAILAKEIKNGKA